MKAKNQKKEINITESLKKLRKILDWFQNQKELDIEQGLKKLKEAAPLIKKIKTRLSNVENEFQEIKKDLTEQNNSKTEL